MKNNKTTLAKMADEYAALASEKIGYPVEVTITPKKILDTIPASQWAHMVSMEFGIPLEVLMSKSRKADLVLVRQLICFSLYNHSSATLKDVGELVGLDHTTIMHNNKKVVDLMMAFDDAMMVGWQRVYRLIKALQSEHR